MRDSFFIDPNAGLLYLAEEIYANRMTDITCFPETKTYRNEPYRPSQGALFFGITSELPAGFFSDGVHKFIGNFGAQGFWT